MKPDIKQPSHGNVQSAQMDLYVYYRVRREHADLLQKTVGGMQRQLYQQYGITATLKRRPEIKQGQHTWMEVYIAAPSTFDKVLEQAVMESGLSALMEGERHIEYFIDFSDCQLKK